jgi:DNA mismatch repair protein MutS
MMMQYLNARAQARTMAPDALLFYRMGDFYELFFEDAVAASAALDIALTKRGQHEGADIAMCGVPVHAMDGYLAKLIRQGFKVAVAEQMENPAEAKKRGAKSVVRREIVRLVTPGTLTEDALLTGSQSNFLCAATIVHEAWAVAWVDMSTGHFFVQSTDASGLSSVLARISAVELLVVDAQQASVRALVPDDMRFSLVPADTADSSTAVERLKRFLGLTTLDGIGSFTRPELAALGIVLAYVSETQRGAMPRLLAPQRLEDGAFMAIDASSIASLELTHSTSGNPKRSLLGVINLCVTASGARLLGQRITAPLTDPEPIAARHDLVELFADNGIVRATMRDRLRQTPDLERALSRLTLGRGTPRDLASIRTGLTCAQDIAVQLDGIARDTFSPCAALEQLRGRFGKHGHELDLLERALVAEPPLTMTDGGFITAGYDASLDHFRSLASEGRRHIAKLEDSYRQSTSISALKIRHNNVIGYHLEVSAKSADSLLADTSFIHRQTMAGAVRFSTVALNDLALKISEAGAKAIALELEHFEKLRETTLHRAPVIASTAQALAETDVATALAEKAMQGSWTRPKIDTSTAFEIENGRHPVVETALTANRQSFIANGCALGIEQKIWLITGPNMAGKSTYLRQNALIAVLAQIGSFVPASFAHIGIVSKLFSRVGASDDLAQGRSTFMVEMVETAAILNQADARSLVILDEVGRGTATYDGLAIAWATLEHLHDTNQCRTLFATHYHELAALKARLANLALFTVAVKAVADQLLFLHQIVPGTADRSYGLNVARMAGIPSTVADRALEVLTRLEADKRPATLMDLPLFNATPVHVLPKTDSLRDALAKIKPDELTPRAALDTLYVLKGLG